MVLIDGLVIDCALGVKSRHNQVRDNNVLEDEANLVLVGSWDKEQISWLVGNFSSFSHAYECPWRAMRMKGRRE